MIRLVSVISCLSLIGLVCSNEDKEDMIIYTYPPPEKYEEYYGSSEGVRELENNEISSNEIPIDLPKNFTNEEYSFTLFSRKYKSGVPISENNTLEELRSVFNPELETKIVVHGWMSSAHSYIVNNTIKVYLAARDINAIAVDWSTLAGYKIYPVTTYSVAPVGRGVAKLALRLLEAQVTTLEKLHLIGHSLGAHVMGVAGLTIFQSAGGKVSRISGLDPASPMFEFVGGYPSRLDPSDAEFVDVIHTAGGAAGYFGVLGHVDFYPNGGTPFMPGCLEISVNAIVCSHGMSYKYYDESISNPKGFRAVKCDSWGSFSNGSCDNNTHTFMGDPVPPNTRGIYYLRTNAEPPYAKG